MKRNIGLITIEAFCCGFGLALIFLLMSSCNQQKAELLSSYCYNDFDGNLYEILTFNLEDSTFEQLTYPHIGGPVKDKGRIVFLKHNKIFLEVRKSKVVQIPFPDSLDKNLTLLEVNSWKRVEAGYPSPVFPYLISTENSILGRVDTTGRGVFEIGDSVKKIYVNYGDGSIEYGAVIEADSFAGTAWSVLLGSKPIYVEESFYYTIKNGYLKSKLGGHKLFPCDSSNP